MKNTVTRITAVICLLALALTLLASCGEKPDFVVVNPDEVTNAFGTSGDMMQKEFTEAQYRNIITVYNGLEVDGNATKDNIGDWSVGLATDAGIIRFVYIGGYKFNVFVSLEVSTSYTVVSEELYNAFMAE